MYSGISKILFFTWKHIFLPIRISVVIIAAVMWGAITWQAFFLYKVSNQRQFIVSFMFTEWTGLNFFLITAVLWKWWTELWLPQGGKQCQAHFSQECPQIHPHSRPRLEDILVRPLLWPFPFPLYKIIGFSCLVSDLWKLYFLVRKTKN